MSTKIGIGDGDGFYIFREYFDDDRVYLRLDEAQFEASSGQLTVAIPLVIWEQIRQCKVADTSYAGLSNDALEAMGRSMAIEVRERKKEDGIAALIGIMNPLTAGTEELEEQEQEAEIIYRLSQRRERDRSLKIKIESFASALNKQDDHE